MRHRQTPARASAAARAALMQGFLTVRCTDYFFFWRLGLPTMLSRYAQQLRAVSRLFELCPATASAATIARALSQHGSGHHASKMRKNLPEIQIENQTTRTVVREWIWAVCTIERCHTRGQGIAEKGKKRSKCGQPLPLWRLCQNR